MHYVYSLIPAKTIYRILIICILVSLIYYPAINAEISLIDDFDMVNDILNTETMSFWNIFVPRSACGGYYRPIIGLSQYIDKKLWMMGSTFMHLENIVFHLINSILVYLLAFKISARLFLKAGSLFPLAAALIFALHPIATESVNWVSGRTDIMACNFILVSAIFLFRYRDDGKKLNLIFSCVALLLSLFAKEVAFGYIIALPFLFSLPRHDTDQAIDRVPHKNSFHPFIIYLLFFSTSALVALYLASYWTVLFLGCCYILYFLWSNSDKKPINIVIKEHFLGISLLALVVLATFSIFFVLRQIAFTSNIDRISNTFRLIFQDMNYAISIFLGAAGFYVKKFFLPLPLNFFILEIDPLYDFIGIAVFFWALCLMLKRNTISALSIAGICCVLPAIPFAFGTIAWTGYAERYIYVASSFWSIAVTLFVTQCIAGRNINNKISSLIPAVFIVILLAMVTVTYQRNITWQTNLALITDTVNKSPRQKELRGLYMLAFIRSGDLKSAREQYKIASSLHSNKYMENYDINMAGVELAEGNKAEAELLFQSVLTSTRSKSPSALRFYAKFLENELRQAKEPDKITSIQNKIISLYNQLYELNHDPFILYRLGQIYIARNDTRNAIILFTKAAQAYTPGSMYGDNSLKILKKLQFNMQP